MAKKRTKARTRKRVPNAIFYRSPKTGKRVRWRSGPPPTDSNGDDLDLFNSRGRRVRKPRKKDRPFGKLNIRRLPSPDTNASINRRAIVSFSRAQRYNLFWLRAATIKPGETEIIWIGTKAFLKPITTKVANGMLRLLRRRATKSGEAILAVDLIRRPKFKRLRKKKRAVRRS